MHRCVLLVAFSAWALPLTAQAPAASTRWLADPAHSSVGFRVRHLGITWVNGTFHQWSAELIYDPEHPERASVAARIAAGSVDTGNERRDNDLRSTYLVTDSFPEVLFISRRVERDATAPNHLRITGDLTLRGVTHPVVLDAEVGGVLETTRGRRTAFSATTAFRRQDYGITLNHFMEGAQVVGDEVRITIDLEAVERTTTP
ncbi:MAG: YceI family protein [Candidatus Dormibacteria bacterium]